MVTLSSSRCPPADQRALVTEGYFGRYLASGHLTYVHDGRLFAVAFDIERLELMGLPVPVVESVSRSVSTGAAQFAASDTGTAVYLPGRIDSAKPLQWLRRDGTTTAFRSGAIDWSNPRISSSGDRLAVDVFDGQQTDVWLYDNDRDTATRLTFDQSEDWMPLWTPDGRRVAFRTTSHSPAFNLFWQRADGGGTAERLTESQNPQSPFSWHPSGNVPRVRRDEPDDQLRHHDAAAQRGRPRGISGPADAVSEHTGTRVQPRVLA